MNEKKIYKQLTKWFPELKQNPLPKKKHRAKAEHFLTWLNSQESEQAVEYMMGLNIHQYLENGLAEHISFTSICNSFASLKAKSNRILESF